MADCVERPSRVMVTLCVPKTMLPGLTWADAQRSIHRSSHVRGGVSARSVLVALRLVCLAVTRICAWLVLLAPSEGCVYRFSAGGMLKVFICSFEGGRS
jgi:hypothetical protein